MGSSCLVMGASSCTHELPQHGEPSCCKAYFQDAETSVGSREASRKDWKEGPKEQAAALPVDRVRPSRRTTVMGGRSLHEQTGFFVYEGKAKEAEWLTVAVEKMWEYIEKSIEKLLKEDITNLIRDELPLMNSFEFTKCKFGSHTPRFGPLKVRAKDNCVELLIDMHWIAAGAEIEVAMGTMKLGMKDIELHGPILLVFCPLMSELPITGGMSITFPDPPALSWKWTGLGKALAVDVIRSLGRRGIQAWPLKAFGP